MTYTLPILALASFALLSCGKKEVHTPDDGHDHGDHGAHALHDHDEKEAHSDKDKHDDHSGHDHSGHEHAKAGPNQGRMIENVSPQAEFLVLDDRKVQITFFDESMTAVTPTSQEVTVVSGERTAPIELTFTAQGDSLVSAEALPEGNNFPTIVAIKTDADAADAVTKFTLNLSECPGCDNQEYACECEH